MSNWSERAERLEVTETRAETGGIVMIRIRHGESHPPQQESSAARARLERLAEGYRPADISIRSGKGEDHCFGHTATITLTTSQRLVACRAVIEAAENTRCACGSYGSWEEADCVSGTSGGRAVIWAGCHHCGSAIGRPVLEADLAWYDRAK